MSVPFRGSSPRGRGKPSLSATDVCAGGLIPAWAGKTHGGATRSHALPAHPRVGGENHVALIDVLFEEGSSPRGRGKQRPKARLSLSTWLIPAWAGKTHKQPGGYTHMRAHPRVGGENR